MTDLSRRAFGALAAGTLVVAGGAGASRRTSRTRSISTSAMAAW